MVTSRIGPTLAAIAGIGLAIVGGADAQTLVQTFVIPAAAVPINDTFTFNLFNTGLGPLNQVTLALSTSVSAQVDVFNFTDTNQQFTNATAVVPVTLTAPDAITEVATATAGPISGTAIPGLNTSAPILTGANSSQIVPMADWSFYEGVGLMTNTLNASSTSGTYGGNGPFGVFFGGSAIAGGTITLTYLYQPAGAIPEPGATTFLAAGRPWQHGFEAPPKVVKLG